MSDITPDASISADNVAQLLEEHYSIRGNIKPLSAERDCNFHISPSIGGERDVVLKVYPSSIPDAEADMLASVLTFVKSAEPSFPVPELVRSRAARGHVTFLDDHGHNRLAIVYSYLAGTPLFAVERTEQQASQCGKLAGQLTQILSTFAHPFMHRDLIWDLRRLPRLRGLITEIDDLPFPEFVHHFLDMFDNDIAGRLDAAPRQFVHNDLNARNIIVDARSPERVVGIIDFGDAVHTARIADVAVGVIGQITDLSSAESMMDIFVDGYRSVHPLTAAEVELLPALVAGRIVQNIVMTAWYRAQDPDNAHFAGFGRAYFAERVEFARRLVARQTA